MIPKNVAKQNGFGVLDGLGDRREELLLGLRTLLPGAITEDRRVDVNAIRKSMGGGGKM